jgi:hypothetical protein
MDILINALGPPGTSPLATINTFLQTWLPPTKGPRAAIMNKNIRRMLDVAKTYNTNLAAIRLSPRVRVTLPAWYHPGAAPRPLTNVKAKCLLKNHTVKSVADLIKIAKKLRICTQNIMHSPSQACICIGCVRDRQEGCKNPHACAVEAKTCLNDITPKYNPLTHEQHDTLSLTPNRKAWNAVAHATTRKGILFASITCKDGIEECFRIFTNPDKISLTTTCRQLQQGIILNHLEMRVYTNGSCMNNGKKDTSCRSGVWVGENHPLNRALKVPRDAQSNQVGKLTAIIAAAETLPKYCRLTIVTDSRYVIDCHGSAGTPRQAGKS